MLYSVILGDHETINNSWEITQDDFHNKTLMCSDLSQRIRLGKTVNASRIKHAWSDASVVAYKLPKNIFVSTSDKNMTVNILNFWSENEEVMKNHTDDNILYVTFMNKDYSLIAYEYGIGVDIIGTYRKNDRDTRDLIYQGCVLRYQYCIPGPIFSLTVFNHKSNKIEKIKLCGSVVDNDYKIYISKDEIEDSLELKTLTKKYQKFKNPAHFRVEVKPGVFLTKTFVVTPTEAKILKKRLNDDPRYNFFIISDEMSEEEIHDLLVENLKNGRIRAITVMGLRLTYETVKDAGIQYIFEYDEVYDYLRCVKSK